MLQIVLRKLTSLSAWRLRSAMGGLFLVLITLGYVLLAIGVHRKDADSVVSSEMHDNDNNNRHTRDLMGQEDRQTMARQRLKYGQNEIMMEGDEEKFLDVMKLRPKMPISIIDPFSKLKNQVCNNTSMLM